MGKSKPEIRLIGYARVSTDDQRLDLQIEALRRAGVQDDDLYVEKKSAAVKARPQLALALKSLHPGDTFMVWRLDRLGRSLPDLINRIKYFEDMDVRFVSLTETIDTKTAQGRFMFHIAGAFAEFERGLTRERTRAGLAVLKAKGVKLGATKKLTDKKFAEARALLLKPQWSIPKVAKKLGVSTSLLFQKFPGGQRALMAELEDARPKRKQ